jgi:hypothetical protein
LLFDRGFSHGRWQCVKMVACGCLALADLKIAKDHHVTV